MPIRGKNQVAMDEQVIRDPACESALEAREAERQALAQARVRYDEVHEKALGEVAKLELPEGAVARVGRFRIERKYVPSRSVSFESKASSRIRIALAGED